MRNITTFDLALLEEFDSIVILVSGGIDSTYLWELISERYPEKCIPYNSFNPYETSVTLDAIMSHPRARSSKSVGVPEFKGVLEESFRQIPRAMADRKRHAYHKKVFPCCAKIKHEFFKKDPFFQENGRVVISGIKWGDGSRRAGWLSELARGSQKVRQCMRSGRDDWLIKEPTFFHRHEWGALYCYPFRDYQQRELPDDIVDELRQKYPGLTHSGCAVCPVLVVFDITNEGKRYHDSVRFARKLGIPGVQPRLDEWFP